MNIEQYMVYDPASNTSYYFFPEYIKLYCETHKRTFRWVGQMLVGECLCGGHCSALFCDCNYKAAINVDAASWNPRPPHPLC